MAEAAPLVVGIDTLADATVSSDVGEEERSASGPRALSCQLAGKSALPTLVTNLRPLGQGVLDLAWHGTEREIQIQQISK